MNRAERRRAARRPEIAAMAKAVAEATACPDCHSDTRIKPDEDGIWHLIVSHDDTCPTYGGATTG